jgi:hypothetical protein
MKLSILGTLGCLYLASAQTTLNGGKVSFLNLRRVIRVISSNNHIEQYYVSAKTGPIADQTTHSLSTEIGECVGLEDNPE